MCIFLTTKSISYRLLSFLKRSLYDGEYSNQFDLQFLWISVSYSCIIPNVTTKIILMLGRIDINVKPAKYLCQDCIYSYVETKIT